MPAAAAILFPPISITEAATLTSCCVSSAPSNQLRSRPCFSSACLHVPFCLARSLAHSPFTALHCCGDHISQYWRVENRGSKKLCLSSSGKWMLAMCWRIWKPVQGALWESQVLPKGLAELLQLKGAHMDRSAREGYCRVLRNGGIL